MISNGCYLMLSFQTFKAMTVHKWSCLGDGRYSAQEIMTLIDAGDDHYMEAVRRMKQTDILIIDEVSMFSQVMFEKLERVMRHSRQSHCLFGGVQIVLVGDFLQLPPVKNSRYCDAGDFCFLSDVFPVHHIFLTEVMRQTDSQFINVVHSIAKGDVDEETLIYVKKLCRPLICTEDTTRLFCVNILADMYNRDCLMGLPGEIYEFEAIDEGEERLLNSLTIQKTLWLKKNAKVMLLRNLSDRMVNGLHGTVLDIKEGEVVVRFQSLDMVTTLTRMNFAVYDPATKRNEAVRNQIPLKLCYAMTVHKAQGMTLNRVEVDCRQIFQPGQLAVAMSRVKSPDHLRVVNFSKSAVISQPTTVLDLFHKQWTPPEPDFSCCILRFQTDSSSETPVLQHSDVTPTSQSDFQCEFTQTEPFSEFDDELLLSVDLDSFTSVKIMKMSLKFLFQLTFC
ncbi:uncharacterized protein LOC132751598 [Ruditapes philippinarum]|uniref:uncharacterized protein LOC132751598 n=1 Tax=Ruditapes philippinarum TaxID=129788 RepID=UPI00295C2703|nr:uncharacterized protein LOC132751598 [Ruditapes philippinarum]